MVTVIKWFVRILLLIIFVDWFNLRTAEDKFLSPAGMMLIDIESRSVVRCGFGCSINDLNEGDVVPIEIRFTLQGLDNESKTEEKDD